MHEGPEFCQETRNIVEQEIRNNEHLYTPCFAPTTAEPGDDHFLVEPVRTDDIHAALKTFRKKTSPGADGITFTVLKQSTPKLVSALAQLFTICLLAGYFPLKWKSAIGEMLLKPGKDSKSAGSYRPISLLSCLGKLFEKVISLRLNLHLGEIGFFNSFQRAYRRGMEGGEHLYRLAEELDTMTKKKYKTAAASLDVEKAFDSV